LFNSFNKYAREDLKYDLTAARERLPEVDAADRDRLQPELNKYGGRTVRYAGVCSIDLATYAIEEASVLATRQRRGR
jgi:hypothetical protein